MDNNKFKPIQRPTYGGSNSTNSYRPNSYNQPPQQQPPQPEYQPPMEPNYQEEYQQPMYSNRNEKKPANKKLIFGIVGAVVAIAVVVSIFAFGGSKGVSKVENVLDSNAETTDLGSGTSLLGGNGTTTANFNGSAVEVPWPSDITPTKMEINLDPTTGDPVLMLVGEKSGVGTVIRSYNKAGALTGFWVIVSSDPALTNENNTANAVTGTTPTLEQTIADEVHTYLGGTIEGKTTNDIIKDYNTELTATATKYGKTVEQVLNYYFVATGITPAN